MTETDRLHREIRRTFDGDAWYGPSLWKLLADVTAEQAAARPVPNAHGIWELVLHISAWEGAVLTRLQGGWTDMPVEGDWPPVPEPTEAAWRKTLDDVRARHDELRLAVKNLSESRLEERLGAERRPETGGGVSVAVTVHGVIQHCVYHAGQIALLKKAVE